ncbi:thy-1 membrane glycoprotein-like [Scyliorhinus canicula]|uniref:thy-1 membrane glycoprotein-like n=1 Tax=Scyliorhinus canicula TaxID=7830 RepID=UPI0018F6E37C|nr:thy-1 membrane glycoprotein-like [Scyliorhinus canicula]
MIQLLILSVMAVLPMAEGLEITKMAACTTKNNNLRVDCNYKMAGSTLADIKYEWSLYRKVNETVVIKSTINPRKENPSFKNRADVNLTDMLLRLTITGFGTPEMGTYMCKLNSKTEVKNDTTSVQRDVAECDAAGCVLGSWMLSLVLALTVLQALDILPCRAFN